MGGGLRQIIARAAAHKEQLARRIEFLQNFAYNAAAVEVIEHCSPDFALRHNFLPRVHLPVIHVNLRHIFLSCSPFYASSITPNVPAYPLRAMLSNRASKYPCR